jgi:hypothetical protein
VKHGKKADFCIEVFGVRSDRAERLRGGPEENVVSDSLVLQGNGGDAFGYSKNNMVVPDRQKLCLSLLQPFSFGKGLAFWTVTVAARNGELSITCLMGSAPLWGVQSVNSAHVQRRTRL